MVQARNDQLNAENHRLLERIRGLEIQTLWDSAELRKQDAEIERLKAGGCARDQRTTQFCGEAIKLQEENAKLQERIARLEEALYVYLQAGHKQARREASVIAKAALAKGTP